MKKLKFGYVRTVRQNDGSYGQILAPGADFALRGRMDAITVGATNFMLIGTKRQMLDWLQSNDIPVNVRTSNPDINYGTDVRMTLSGISKPPIVEWAESFMTFWGGGTSIAGVGAAAAANQAGPIAQAVIGGANLPVGPSIDSAQSSLVEKLGLGKRMILEFEVAMAAQHARVDLRQPSVEKASGQSTTAYAADLVRLPEPG